MPIPPSYVPDTVGEMKILTKSIQKKMKAHKTDHGSFNTKSGYVKKTSPGPINKSK